MENTETKIQYNAKIIGNTVCLQKMIVKKIGMSNGST